MALLVLTDHAPQTFSLAGEQFLAKILAFNVGVELGQAAALIPIVLAIRG